MTQIPPRPTDSNLPEFTVSELSRALKRTVEEAYSYVRVRGEVSGFKRAGSGHCYMALKDADAVLDAVCWKGTAVRLAVQPEDGLEVVCSGRLTTYPGRSKYQLVIDTMELAGEGALLKLLEERRKKLAAEGLFDDERKKPLPYLPEVIGVVTSPTGAVIRDILHRLADRFPRHVLLWPVLVQGDGAAAQIAAAIRGFNSLAPGGAVPRPDVLIVARGGGSLEDLWAFNEEIVVRAAAESAIPLIAAVGHETDWTLIDHAADRRAPTPTAAAEMAVPVRAELVATVMDRAGRLVAAAGRLVAQHKLHLDGLSRGLPDLMTLVGTQHQRLDVAFERLEIAVRGRERQKADRIKDLGARLRRPDQIVALAGRDVSRTALALRAAYGQLVLRKDNRLEAVACHVTLQPVERRIEAGREAVEGLGPRLVWAAARHWREQEARTRAAGDLLESYSFRRVLERGYVVVRDASGVPVTAKTDALPGSAVTLEFADGTAPATVDGATPAAQPQPAGKPSAGKASGRKGASGDRRQGTLL